MASFYGLDGHNNVRYLTDSGGRVTDTYDYDAFGNPISRTGGTPNVYLFTGEQFDPDLGFYFLRARYQNPDTGRFWTMDSYEGSYLDPASLHKYAYAGSDPINKVDPTGRVEEFEQLVAARIAGTLAQTEANIGFATFQQIMYGGNAGIKSLVVGGVIQLGIPAVLISVPKARAIAGLILGGLSKASRLNYVETFFREYPLLAPFRDQIVVHHAVPQAVLTKYPGVFTELEIHSIDNLRGIPKVLNSEVHLSAINSEWETFYRMHATATQADLLQFASYIDSIYGGFFIPPL